MKRSRPRTPMYLDLQPADHSLTIYSTPKNATRQISCIDKNWENQFELRYCKLEILKKMTLYFDRSHTHHPIKGFVGKAFVFFDC